MKALLFTLIICIFFFQISKASDLPDQLNDQCPPSFEKLDNGTCALRSLYDLYDSPTSHGGFRVNLPKQTAFYSPEQIDLGRFLFFDPVLSKNKDLSCASCHQLENSLSDGRARSISGLDEHGKRGTLKRTTPTLWNIAYHKQFMWDGRATSLPEQALLPLFSKEEMGNNPEQLKNDLNAIPQYVDWFQQAFSERPSVDNTAIALAAFQSTLISLNSRYDRYVHGDENALNEQEVKGYNSFRGFVGRCSQCHMPPLFTDGELAVIGSPATKGLPLDKGAGALSNAPNMLGAFRVPTLRNISKTAPYFHAGQLQDLSDVMDFYNNTRGHMAPKELDLDIHWHVHMTKGSQLSNEDEQNIIAFLSALDDETLLPQKPLTVPSGININNSEVTE